MTKRPLSQISFQNLSYSTDPLLTPLSQLPKRRYRAFPTPVHSYPYGSYQVRAKQSLRGDMATYTPTYWVFSPGVENRIPEHLIDAWLEKNSPSIHQYPQPPL